MSKRNPNIGVQIQRLRRDKGLSQAQLAAAIDISPSYLNLIEHNRRRITVALLLKFAHFFGIEASELAHNDRSRLVGDLMELFGDELFSDFELTNHDISDLATTNPRIGQALVRLYDRYLAVGKKNGGAPAVLDDTSLDIASDAISDFLQLNLNYFDTLEMAAERIRHDIDLASDSFDYGLRAYLLNAFGLRWRQIKLPDEQAFRIDVGAGELETGDVLPAESATFIVA